MCKLPSVLPVVRKNQQPPSISGGGISRRAREEILVKRVRDNGRRHEVAGVKARHDFGVCARSAPAAKTLSSISVSVIIRLNWHTNQAEGRTSCWADLA